MNKYLAVMVGVFLSLNAFADSYVFGGRAHFSGSLVNPSCAFMQASNLQDLTPSESKSLLVLNVSSCSSAVFHNLGVELIDANSKESLSYVEPVSGEQLYLMSKYNLQKSIGQKESSGDFSELVNIGQDTELTNIDETTVVLPLVFISGQLPKNSTNILISVFYP